MDHFNAIILGIIQGLTEFLPVSSSGHLEIGKVILGHDLNADESLMMTVVLHAATALATLVAFRGDVLAIFRGLLQFRWNDHARFTAKVIVSMVPAVIIGLTMEDEIEELFSGDLVLVGTMLIVTGILLFLADRAKNTSRDVSFLHAVIIGVAQAIAILPGISRSGATISTSVLLGIDRMKAARFSFLMVVPLILGKMAKDILDGALAGVGANSAAAAPTLSITVLLVGFAAAFVTGIIACKWMLQLVKKCQLWWFSIYCFVVGAISIGYELMYRAGNVADQVANVAR